MDYRKKFILKLSGAMLFALLLLTFFSNTIYSLNIPGVVVGFYQSGIIATNMRAEGFVDFSQSHIMYADNSGRVIFAVQANDRVQAGDLLYTIYSDTEATLNLLAVYHMRLDRIAANRTMAQADLNFAQARASLMLEVPPPDMTRFDLEDARLEMEIELAGAEFQRLTQLVESGAIPRIQLDAAHTRLDNLTRDTYRNGVERAQVLAEFERSRHLATEENRIASEQRLSTYRHSLLLLDIEEAEINQSIDTLQAQLYTTSIVQGFAEYDMVVQDFVGLETGMFVDINRPVMRLAMADEHRIVVDFPESLWGFIYDTMAADSSSTEPSDGIIVRVDIPSINEFGIIGHVERLTSYRGRTRVDITFPTTANMNGGERAVVRIEYFSELFDNILPNHAIREDNDGTFILYAERSDARFNAAYFARRMNIEVIQEGDRNTSFRMADIEIGAVILQSDRPVQPDERIRLVSAR